MKHAELNGKAVPLIGNEKDLQYLSEQFCFDDFGIYRVKSSRVNPETNKEEYDYYLKSSSFDSKTDNREIINDAVDILDLINGEAQLEVKLFISVKGKIQGGPSLELVQVDSRVDEFKEGIKISHTLVVSPAPSRLIPSDLRKFLESQRKEVPRYLQKLDDTKSIEVVTKQLKVMETRFPLLKLVESDENVREALAFFGHQHSWANLYRAWDDIKKDKDFNTQDFSDFVEGTIITSTNKKRFSQTADYHRHGRAAKKKLPEKPMDLEEAEHFIRVLMLYWVSWKYNVYP